MQFKRFYVLLVLLAFAVSAAGAERELRVGAAKVDVTGPFGPSQTGKYDHERVYVRAIVLDNGVARAALISVESGQFDWTATLKEVGAALNCPVENVIMSGTHTHSPSAGPARRPTDPQPPDASRPSKAVLEAVREARAKLEPARVGFGTGSLSLNVNRDAIDPNTRKWTQYSNLDAPSDKTVTVLSFFKPTGEPIAVYVNYAMHPIDGYVMGVVSGDFPGAMSRYVEKAFGDNIIVAFTQGASGDQNPLYLRPSNNAMASRVGNKITGFEINREASEGPLRDAEYKGPAAKPADPKVIDDMFRFIESEGQIFGEEVIRVMTWTKKTTGEVRIAGVQKEVSCPGRKRTNGDPFDPKTREGMEGTYVDAPPRIYKIGVLGVGTVALAWINAEIYTQIGLEAKNESPLKNTMIVTIANGSPGGYTPDDSSYGRQTFQVLESSVKPGCAETAIVNTVSDLETQYVGGK
jgi:Neutral/alkaline non-lysosomal ceramidase, N-terminal